MSWRTITRRAFLSLSTAGSFVIASKKLLAQSPSPIATQQVTPQPSPTPTPPAVPLGTPGSLMLSGSDGDVGTRGATYLELKWEKVPDADRYELQVTWLHGQEIVTSIEPNTRLNALASNRTYEIRVRASNSKETSSWSEPLITCTRPLKPNPASQRYSSMVDVPKTFTIYWDLAGLSAQLDDAALIKVNLGRMADNQKVILIKAGLKPSDEQVVDNDMKTNSYHIQLVSPNDHVSGGQNTSEWSLGITPSSLQFSGLRFPMLQETNRLSVKIMRNYYG